MGTFCQENCVLAHAVNHFELLDKWKFTLIIFVMAKVFF